MNKLSFLLIFLVLISGCHLPKTDRDASGIADSIPSSVIKKDRLCLSCWAPSGSRLLSLQISKDSIGNSLGKNGTQRGLNESAALKDRAEEEMVYIKGGSFQMGSNAFEDSKPIHKVYVNSFYMDAYEVTNASFEKFVQATGYITISERPLNPADYPGVAKDKLQPGSAVFTPPNHAVDLHDITNWWQYRAGANWRHPDGPGSSIKGKENYPVVQISYLDAIAYARWAKKRLPTEAEWEYAGRAGVDQAPFYWGNGLKPNGKWAANIFQGHFPDHNTSEDGFSGLAPVGSFSPNRNGLYDMEGNVWEWCQDFYRSDYYRQKIAINPKGPGSSYDPAEPGVIKRVQRGGSFLCSDQYCDRYRAGSRGKGEINSASNNLGFRCVRDITVANK